MIENGTFRAAQDARSRPEKPSCTQNKLQNASGPHAGRRSGEVLLAAGVPRAMPETLRHAAGCAALQPCHAAYGRWSSRSRASSAPAGRQVRPCLQKFLLVSEDRAPEVCLNIDCIDGRSGWAMILDDITGAFYYWHMDKDLVTWDIPAGLPLLACALALALCESQSLSKHDAFDAQCHPLNLSLVSLQSFVSMACPSAPASESLCEPPWLVPRASQLRRELRGSSWQMTSRTRCEQVRWASSAVSAP